MTNLENYFRPIPTHLIFNLALPICPSDPFKKGRSRKQKAGKAARKRKQGASRTRSPTQLNRRQRNDSKLMFCYNQAMNDDEIQTHIADRNRLRGASGLPLLSIESETTRLRNAREDAQFERYYQSHPERYVYDPDRNNLENAGQYSIRRNKLRKKFNAESNRVTP